MASTSEIISILIKADGKAAVRELEKVGGTAERELGRSTKATRDWSASFTRAGSVLVTGAAAVGAGLFKMAQAADESALAQARLENTLRNAPQLAGESADAFLDLADAVRKNTVVDDEAVLGVESFLGSVGRTKDEILTLTPLIVDLARKTGTDLDSAARAVNKSVDGTARGLRGLGVNVDTAAVKTDGFNTTVEALRSSVGGFAQTEAESFSGQLQQFRNQLGELSEGIGAGVLPVIQELVGGLGGLADKFSELDPATQATVGRVAAVGTAATGAIGGVSLLAGQVAKLKDRFLKDTTQGLGGGLTGFGKAAAGAAGAAAVLGVAWVAMSEKSDRAKRKVKELTSAVQENGVTLGDAASRGLRDYLAENEKAGPVLAALGVSVEDVNRAIQGSDAEFASFKQRVEDLTDPLEQGADFNAKLAVQAQNVGSELKAQRAAFESAKSEIARYNATTEELRNKTGDASTAVTDLGEQADGAAGDIDKLREATEKLNEAEQRRFDDNTRRREELLGIASSQRDVTKAQIEAVRAQEDLIDAQTAYDEALAEFGPGSQEARDAQRELQDAFINVTDSADAAKLAVLKYGEDVGKAVDGNPAKAINNQITALEGVRDQLAPGSPLRRYLEDYIKALREDIPKQVATELIVNARIQQTGRFNEARDARAIGGPVGAGRPYLVGERGPEVFRPSVPGVIIPNNAIRGSDTPPVVYNVTVNAGVGTDSVELEQAVTRAIANARRRGVTV